MALDSDSSVLETGLLGHACFQLCLQELQQVQSRPRFRGLERLVLTVI